MAKGGAKTTTTQKSGLTGASQGLQNNIYGAAQDAANNYTTVGPNAATTGALDNYQGAMAAGQNGLAALGGDSAAMAKFANPYQQQVVDASNAQYGRAQAGLSANVNDAATRAGAFGGSRHGVAEGVAQGQLASDHQAQLASLLQSGYGNAQGVAGQLANMGMGATAGAAGIGDYLRQIQQEQANPGAAKLGLLNQGMAGGGNASTSSTQTTQAPGTSALQNILGAGTMVAGMFPGGGALKAGMGLFGQQPTPPTFGGYQPRSFNGGLFGNG